MTVMELMAIPLPARDSKWAPYFRRLYELGLPLLRRPIDSVPLKELSQGMLTDYHVAVEKVAMTVRVWAATNGTRRA